MDFGVGRFFGIYSVCCVISLCRILACVGGPTSTARLSYFLFVSICCNIRDFVGCTSRGGHEAERRVLCPTWLGRRRIERNELNSALCPPLPQAPPTASPRLHLLYPSLHLVYTCCLLNLSVAYTLRIMARDRLAALRVSSCLHFCQCGLTLPPKGPTPTSWRYPSRCRDGKRADAGPSYIANEPTKW